MACSDVSERDVATLRLSGVQSVDELFPKLGDAVTERVGTRADRPGCGNGRPERAVVRRRRTMLVRAKMPMPGNVVSFDAEDRRPWLRVKR